MKIEKMNIPENPEITIMHQEEMIDVLRAKLDVAIDALEDYRDMPGWSCTKSTTKYSTATIALDKLKITGSSEGNLSK